MKRILVIGDAWGLCYERDYSYSVDKIIDTNLATLLNNFEGNDCYNYCRQNLSNLNYVQELQNVSINPNDILVVVQADPLKDIVNTLPVHQTKFIGKTYIGPNKQEHNVHEGLPAWVPYKPRWGSGPAQTFQPPMQKDLDYAILETSIEQLLSKFYNQLNEFQKERSCKILLHGGSSKVNAYLAHKNNIQFTLETSTEIIVNGFTDGYFSNQLLVEHALIKLKHHFPNFTINTRAEIFSTLRRKKLELTSDKNRSFFTGTHLTVLGQQKVAEYINNLL